VRFIGWLRIELVREHDVIEHDHLGSDDGHDLQRAR
jgi:hypothetical protein